MRTRDSAGSTTSELASGSAFWVRRTVVGRPYHPGMYALCELMSIDNLVFFGFSSRFLTISPYPDRASILYRDPLCPYLKII